MIEYTQPVTVTEDTLPATEDTLPATGGTLPHARGSWYLGQAVMVQRQTLSTHIPAHPRLLNTILVFLAGYYFPLAWTVRVSVTPHVGREQGRRVVGATEQVTL